MSPLLGPDGRPLESAPEPPVQPADDYKDRWLRLQAEFDNARKRFVRERQELEERAGERVLADVLSIVDDFERALAAAAGDSDPEHLRAGLAMIHRRMLDWLKAHGVEPIAAVGRPFDPARHEAVAHAPSEQTTTPQVAEELRKGYLYRGRVMRPATVVTGPSAPTS